MSDRKVLVAISKDGGHHWSDWREASLGEIGEYQTRVVFRRFGTGRGFVMKVRITSPIRADFMGCVGEFERGE